MNKKKDTKNTPKKRRNFRYPPEVIKRLEERGFKRVKDGASYVLPIWSPEPDDPEPEDDE